MSFRTYWLLLLLLHISTLLLEYSDLIQRQQIHLATPALETSWSRVGLRVEDLNRWVQDDSCNISERYFLACANALSQVALKFGLKLNSSGELQDFNQGNKLTVWNEKNLLQEWDFANRQNISFEKIWQQQLVPKIPAKKRAMYTALAINGFLSVFIDPHTYIVPEEYFRKVVASSIQNTSALGVTFSRSNSNYFVQKVIQGSLADQYGLKKGDEILRINSKWAHTISPSMMSDVIKEEFQNSITFEVRRGENKFLFHIPKKVVQLPALVWRKIHSEKKVTALVTLHKFSIGSCYLMKKTLKEIKNEKISSLVLDLRDNLGGQMFEASCISSLFVGNQKPIFRTKYLTEKIKDETFYGNEKQIWSHKIAILINAGSASASEILAGSLREHNAAVLVGERSYGKGSFQEGEVWNLSSKVILFKTKGFYYLPSGYATQLSGLVPDYPIVLAKTDNQREQDQFMFPLVTEHLSDSWGRPALTADTCDLQPGNDEDRQIDAAYKILNCHLNLKPVKLSDVQEL